MVDHYHSLDSLMRNNRRGIDFRVRSLDRSNDVTVMSIHGGIIEKGTTEIAKAVAGDDFNFFNFSALKESGGKFHITSHKFDNKSLDNLLDSSFVGVSVHGCRKKGLGGFVCVGGLNDDLKRIMIDKLKSEGFNVDVESFPGVDSKNIVNRPRKCGVQLELDYDLRKSFFDSFDVKRLRPNDLFFKFVSCVRESLDEYIRFYSDNGFDWSFFIRAMFRKS